MGMFGYMTDTETVKPLDTVDMNSEGQKPVNMSSIISYALNYSLKSMCILFFLFKGDDMESLLFHFLDDWLFRFSDDPSFVARVSLWDGYRSYRSTFLHFLLTSLSGGLLCDHN